MLSHSFLRRTGICLSVFTLIQLPAFGHVKWFSSFAYIDKPLSLPEILTPLFFILALTSLLGISASVFIDDFFVRQPWYKKIEDVLNKYAGKSDLIIRIATGSVLLLSWQSGTWLVPELDVENQLIEFSQLILALLIVSNRLTRYAGVGLILHYFAALYVYDFVHLFDYIYILGAGYYLVVVSSPKKTWRASALPALYASVGFSLFWVAIEKIVYPQWALSILNSKPFLTMGFDPEFFLLASAFVEISLGFLLIVCLLQRPIALAITGLFISTTLVFGKLEFIGHAIVHAALIVFVLRGSGTTFRTPITFFYHIHQRVIFSALAFSLMLVVLIPWYTHLASRSYEIAMENWEEDPHDIQIETAGLADIPTLNLTVEQDSHSGWNLFLDMSNFQFTPEHCGEEHIMGHGHAHLYLNGQKVARLYGPWYHLGDLKQGSYTLEISLNGNNHGLYVYNGEAIMASQTLIVN